MSKTCGILKIDRKMNKIFTLASNANKTEFSFTKYERLREFNEVWTCF